MRGAARGREGGVFNRNPARELGGGTRMCMSRTHVRRIAIRILDPAPLANAMPMARYRFKVGKGYGFSK